MKILILTPRIPYPLRDGGAIAMNQTIEGYLDQHCELSVLAMNTARHWTEESELPPMYQKLHYFESIYINNSINPFSAFINLFTDKSYNVERFINKKFEQALIQILKKETFDIIQFESIYTSPYLECVKKHSQAKTFCRVHNIEYEIWNKLAVHESSFFKRKYLSILTNRLKNYELDMLTKFDLLLPISKKEELFLQIEKINQCYHLPFGVSDEKEFPPHQLEMNSCYHIGSMDWAPNVEGVEWFLQDVWQEVSKLLPDVTFYIAGKNMSASFLAKKDEQVTILGEVDDFIEFSLQKNIMIVPLKSGAGIRIKILEAMELGKTIISTSIGAEGIGAIHNEHILIADTAEDFKKYLVHCFNHPEDSIRIGQNAKKYVFSRFHKDEIYKEALTVFNNLI